MTTDIHDDKIRDHSLAHLAFSANWRSEIGSHEEWLHVEKFNVWRDIDLLPSGLRQDLIGCGVGDAPEAAVVSGDLIAPRRDGEVRDLKRSAFVGRSVNGQPLAPHAGRFYPKGMIEGVDGIYSENMEPMRILRSDEDGIRIDLNHPMAGRDLRIGVEVLEVHPAPDEHGGRCNEAMADLLHGPGMQVRIRPDRATDFLVNGALSRPDNDSDTLFYSIPRMVQHLDARCLIEVQRLYRRLLAGRDRVLDLMASWDCHLPDELPFQRVVGLGMNRDELEANGRLNAYEVHDLNRRPILPFDDASFDAVVCSVSVEYLTDPLAIFREVSRVLAPGGIFVVTFSNRWFPGKAINLWVDLHEFERLGLVSEYFLQAGGFEDLHTLSQRGLPRPLGDPHYGKSPFADPLYAVWASKAG